MRHLRIPNHLRTTLIFALALAVSGCDSSGTVDTEDPVAALTVSAGDNQSVDEGTSIDLTGSVQNVTGTMTIEWLQISGPMLNFDATDTLSVTISAPRLRDTATAVLQLSVNDGSTTAIDEVQVTIVNVANGPNGPSPQGIGDRDRNDRRMRDRDGRRMAGGREVRSYDGSGNNIDNPSWGTSFSHLQRLGPVGYADGVSTLAGPERASSRFISNEVIEQGEGVSIPNAFNRSDMVWQWGQFIDHDLGLTDGAEESADIEVPRGDPDFDPGFLGTVVIPFSRALFDATTGTDITNPREQENEITSWIDGSMIYGSDEVRALALREGVDSPFLATSPGNLLPFNTDELSNAVGFVTDPTSLFLAGDVRANEQVGLATMHTLWVREHNRIAQSLIDNNFSTDAEVIFQQARRLVIAKIQKITYEEYLPALHGPDPLPTYSGYDPSINPTMYNEFVVAAYRFGHSLLNEQLLRLDASSTEINAGHLLLRQAFFTAPSILVDEDSLDPILRGLATQRHQMIDTKVVEDLRSFLFGAPGDGGLDLAALNIQRGRDHGVGSYNDVREAIGLERYTSFDQITSDAEVQAALVAAYDNDVDRIDLWVGGLAEDTIGESQFGPLFHTIILRQFQELRDGDRFWYERDLTRDELRRITNVTLAEVIRDNTGIGNELSDDVFTAP
ncbi:MAG: peroxidase family protein [Pseudomonadota bacterium]